MDWENIKTLLADKSILQIIWITFFTLFLALAKVFYEEVKTTYDIIRSGILSISAWMIVGFSLWELGYSFLIVLLGTSLTSFVWDKFFDWIIAIAKQFPTIFTDILKSYINGRWGKQ